MFFSRRLTARLSSTSRARTVPSPAASRRWCATSASPPSAAVARDGANVFEMKKAFLFDRSTIAASDGTRPADSALHASDDIEAELAWEAEGLEIFSTHTTEEERMRAQKTREFLRVLLTTPDAQEWRDMLTAAVQLNTWKPHHMESALRGIVQRPDAAPAPASPTAREAAGRRVSTPSQRLQRVHDIVRLWWELAAEQQAIVSPDSERGIPPKPSEVQVYHVLVQLVRAAQNKHGLVQATHDIADDAASPSAPPPSSPQDLPQASFAEVWRFLAWMEQHHYHLLSSSILPDLEAAVDAEEPSVEVGEGGAATPGTSRYAVISRRVNRLEYLKGEREAIRQRARASSENDGHPPLDGTGREAPNGGEAQTRRGRRPERPQMEPVM